MRRLAAAAIAALLLIGCEARGDDTIDAEGPWCFAEGQAFNITRATACVAQRLDEQNQLLVELIEVLRTLP